MSPPVSLSLASASSVSSLPQALKLKQGDALRIYASDALDKVEEVKFQSLPHQRFQVTVPTMRAATNGRTEWVKHILELTADERGEVQLKIQMRDGVKSYEGATGQIRAKQAEYTEQELADLQASHDVDSNSAAQSPAPSKESSEVSISQLNVKFSNNTDTAATPEIRHFRQGHAISDLIALSTAGQSIYHGLWANAGLASASRVVQANDEQVSEQLKEEEQQREVTEESEEQTLRPEDRAPVGEDIEIEVAAEEEVQGADQSGDTSRSVARQEPVIQPESVPIQKEKQVEQAVGNEDSLSRSDSSASFLSAVSNLSDQEDREAEVAHSSEVVASSVSLASNVSQAEQAEVMGQSLPIVRQDEQSTASDVTELSSPLSSSLPESFAQTLFALGDVGEKQLRQAVQLRQAQKEQQAASPSGSPSAPGVQSATSFDHLRLRTPLKSREQTLPENADSVSAKPKHKLFSKWLSLFSKKDSV